MQITAATLTNIATDAVSNDGRVVLSNGHAGTCNLMDKATGRYMWRGLYADADGLYRDDRVPADLWAVAVELMHSVDAHNNDISEAIRRSNFAHLEAMAEAIPDAVLDMDQANSDH